MSEGGGLLCRRKEFSQARELLQQAEPHHQAAMKAAPMAAIFRDLYLLNRARLASCLAGLGEHHAAIRIADELVRFDWKSPWDRDTPRLIYLAACTLATCIPSAETDAKLLETERKALTRSYGDQALALLGQAITNGYKDEQSLEEYRKDLDPLRSRPEFQMLEKELEKR
jgi:hypothetical protein